MIDRDRRIVNANEAANRMFAASQQRGNQRIQRIGIEWLITDVDEHFCQFGELLESLLDVDEHHLRVIARRLDGMNFHANVRIVPTEQDSRVSHILYVRGASRRAVF